MVGTATVALLRHRKLRQGELRFDALMIAGSLVGVTTGARVVGALQHAGNVVIAGRSVPLVTPALYGSYVVFLVACGLALLKRSRGNVEVLSYVRRGPLARIALPPYVDLPSLPLSRVSAIVIAYVGLGLGFLSGLLGVGGGIALMPVLMYGFGFPLRQAAGTGIVVLLITSVGGTVAHALSGNVHLGLCHGAGRGRQHQCPVRGFGHIEAAGGPASTRPRASDHPHRRRHRLGSWRAGWYERLGRCPFTPSVADVIGNTPLCAWLA